MILHKGGWGKIWLLKKIYIPEDEDDDQPIYPCDLCGCYTESFKKLQRHKEKTHGIHSCNQCVFSARQACNLKRHKDLVHCGLQRFYEADSNQKKNVLFCDQCDFSTKRHNRLKAHKDADHLGMRYKCGKCSTLFKRPDHLKRHKLNFHSRIYWILITYLVKPTHLF